MKATLEVARGKNDICYGHYWDRKYDEWVDDDLSGEPVAHRLKRLARKNRR